MTYTSVGKRIKAARKRQNITQETLATLAELSPMHISVIERGVKLPRLETFIRIANILSISADELLQDVVEYSSPSLPVEISELISDLPKPEQEKILYCVKLYVEAYQKTAK